MVTQNKGNNHQGLNNQRCLTILSWLTFNGFKCSKEEIKDFLDSNKDLPSQSMCEKLISISKKENTLDDITLFVIKVI